MGRSTRKLLAAGIALILCGAQIALADYAIGPGDVLSVSVIGQQGLDRQVMIDGESRIFLPLIGKVDAGGKTLSDLRNEIAKRFAEVTYQVEKADGRDSVQTISPDVVVVDIAQYRPVYVMGDVARPGEVPFRPSMTAMQALAIAGGAGRLRSDGDGAEMIAIQLQSRAKVLGETIAQHRLAIERMEADLKNLMSDVPEMPEKLETDGVPSWVEARQTARAFRHEATEVTIEHLRRRLGLLAEHEEGAQRSVELDAKQVTRMEGLAADGYVTANPLLDARKSLLLSTSRALEIAAERGRVEVQLVERSLSDDVEDHIQSAEIIERLEERRSHLTIAQEERRSTIARLAEIGHAPIEEVEWVIHRDEGEGLTRITATGASRLEPGDVLEIRLLISSAEAEALQ